MQRDTVVQRAHAVTRVYVLNVLEDRVILPPRHELGHFYARWGGVFTTYGRSWCIAGAVSQDYMLPAVISGIAVAGDKIP